MRSLQVGLLGQGTSPVMRELWPVSGFARSACSISGVPAESTALSENGDVIDDLRLDELEPVGGHWSGLLFENPAASYPLALTWSFTIEFAEIARHYGSVAPNLTIEWVPAGSAGWRTMGGQRFRCRAFGDPVEASVYFFEHHRYDKAHLAIGDQRGAELELRALLAGDIDGLGLPEIEAVASIEFSGIYVQSERIGTDTIAAAEVLGRFTDTTGLRPLARTRNVVFEIE